MAHVCGVILSGFGSYGVASSAGAPEHIALLLPEHIKRIRDRGEPIFAQCVDVLGVPGFAWLARGLPHIMCVLAHIAAAPAQRMSLRAIAPGTVWQAV